MIWYDTIYDMIYDTIWYDLLQLIFHLVAVVGRILQIKDSYSIVQNEKYYTNLYKRRIKKRHTKEINKYKIVINKASKGNRN